MALYGMDEGAYDLVMDLLDEFQHGLADGEITGAGWTADEVGSIINGLKHQHRQHESAERTAVEREAQLAAVAAPRKVVHDPRCTGGNCHGSCVVHPLPTYPDTSDGWPKHCQHCLGNAVCDGSCRTSKAACVHGDDSTRGTGVLDLGSPA